MSTCKTENYHLHVWSLEDEESLAELNENFAVIDGAISNRCRIVFGTYTGSGGTMQTIDLGGSPRAVLISRGGRSWNGNLSYGGIIYPDYPSTNFEITESGFRTLENSSSNNRSNELGSTYQFMAFFWEE